MLSRIADSLFWLNRYMERADGLLRVTYVHYILSLDKGMDSTKTWRSVLQLFTTAQPELIEQKENDTVASLNYLLTEAENHNSLKAILTKARENARGVQDHITKELWEEVNQMYHLVNDPDIVGKLNDHEAIKVVELFAKHGVLYYGTAEITMSRGTGWDFMSLGRYIERCLQTIALTEKQLQLLPADKQQYNDIFSWRYLLLSLSGYEMHLKTYHTTQYFYNIMHQVILNDNFPHSILYSLKHIDIYLQRIAGKNESENAHLLHTFGRLYSKIKFMDLETLDHSGLEQLLYELKDELLAFSKQVSEQFFSYY